MNVACRRSQTIGTTARDYRIVFDAAGAATVTGSVRGVAPPVVVRVNDQPIADAFATALAPHLADLIDVATAVYTVDRLCKRGTDTLSWARTLVVTLPVRDPELWSRQSAAVADVLQVLTGDAWCLDFVRRAADPRPSEAQGTLFPEPVAQPAAAMLFSGGLDSLAGLTRALRENCEQQVVAVSIRQSTRIIRYQKSSFDALQARFPGRIQAVGIRVDLVRSACRGFDGEERSQRTRGFLFQAIGAASAIAGGVSHLMVPENGIGAINLPYLSSQFSTQAGRAASPLVVTRLANLVSAVSGAPFTISLPNLFLTKAELLTSLGDASVEAAIHETVSCDKFGFRSAGFDHCGICTSCVLRRQSLFSAGLTQWDSSARYLHNVWASRNDKNTSAWFRLHAMTSQSHRLGVALGSTDVAHSLIQEFPALFDQFAQDEGHEKPTRSMSIIDLYKRYCVEWRGFTDNIRAGIR